MVKVSPCRPASTSAGFHMLCRITLFFTFSQRMKYHFLCSDTENNNLRHVLVFGLERRVPDQTRPSRNTSFAFITKQLSLHHFPTFSAHGGTSHATHNRFRAIRSRAMSSSRSSYSSSSGGGGSLFSFHSNLSYKLFT